MALGENHITEADDTYIYYIYVVVAFSNLCCDNCTGK